MTANDSSSACTNPDLVGGSCTSCGQPAAQHQQTEADGRPVLYYSAGYREIACVLHAPRQAVRAQAWRRMSSHLYTILTTAIGATIGCNVCRSYAHRTAPPPRCDYCGTSLTANANPDRCDCCGTQLAPTRTSVEA